MIEVAKDLEIKVTGETIIKAARSFPREDQEATTPNRHTTISDDVNMAEPSIATAPKTRRLVLNPPKRERSPSMENRRPYQPRSSQPKHKKSVAVECILLRLGQPKKKGYRTESIALEEFSIPRTEIEPAKALESRGKLQVNLWSGPQSLDENKEIREAVFPVGTLVEISCRKRYRVEHQDECKRVIGKC